MGKVTGLATFPLTGARALACESVLVGPGGINGSRLYVAYDEVSGERVSQKQERTLAQVEAGYDNDALILHHESAGKLIVPYIGGPATLQVVEFTDPTPCVDVGDQAAEFLSQFRPGLRLAQKAFDWTEGHGGIHPLNRANAPLHIVFDESVKALQKLGEGMDFGAERFRADMRVRGFKAFTENNWIGRKLYIGDLAARVTRLATRCPVPGNDQLTGKNLKDVPRLYRNLQKSAINGKPAFGIYAVPIISDQRRFAVAVNDNVELADA